MVEKLVICQEMMRELVTEVSVTEASDEGSLFSQLFAEFGGLLQGDILTVLTLVINVVVMFSYNHRADCIHCTEAFGDIWTLGLFSAVASFHVIMCVLGFGAWITTRAPVLMFKQKRSAYLRNLRFPGQAQYSIKAGAASFRVSDVIAAAVHASIELVTRLLGKALGVLPFTTHEEYLSLKYEPEFHYEVPRPAASSTTLDCGPEFSSID
jgi:hypothetical protein